MHVLACTSILSVHTCMNKLLVLKHVKTKVSPSFVLNGLLHIMKGEIQYIRNKQTFILHTYYLYYGMIKTIDYNYHNNLTTICLASKYKYYYLYDVMYMYIYIYIRFIYILIIYIYYYMYVHSTVYTIPDSYSRARAEYSLCSCTCVDGERVIED